MNLLALSETVGAPDLGPYHLLLQLIPRQAVAATVAVS
jgi:hypothetical protein